MELTEKDAREMVDTFGISIEDVTLEQIEDLGRYFRDVIDERMMEKEQVE